MVHDEKERPDTQSSSSCWLRLVILTIVLLSTAFIMFLWLGVFGKKGGTDGQSINDGSTQAVKPDAKGHHAPAVKPVPEEQPASPMVHVPVEQRWSQFDHNSWHVRNNLITLSNGDKTASGNRRNESGRVDAAGTMVRREDRATGTVRVDLVRPGGWVEVGVVTSEYYGGRDCNFDKWMSRSSHAWCYYTSGIIFHAGEKVKEGLPMLITGSEITVTLKEGTVTFTNENTIHSFQLPEKCGRISLGVTASDATVTLL